MMFNLVFEKIRMFSVWPKSIPPQDFLLTPTIRTFNDAIHNWKWDQGFFKKNH